MAWPRGVIHAEHYDLISLVSDSASGVNIAHSGPYVPLTTKFNQMYAQHLDSTGAVRWKHGGVVFANYDSGNRNHPASVSDGKGGIIAVWDEYHYQGPSSFNGIFAGRVTAQGEVATAVQGVSNSNIPENIGLSQNYPNPFNPTTTIHYQLKENSSVKIVVFDLLGREGETLINKKQNTGEYVIDFNGSRFHSGIFFYRMTVGSQIITKKMVLLHYR